MKSLFWNVALRLLQPPWECEIGPRLLEQRPPLFKKHFAKVCGQYQKMLLNMCRSAEARQSEKYQEIYTLLQELEGLGDGSYGK